jgi:radical SAM protein with 4Fe4S-binding SPASM domain
VSVDGSVGTFSPELLGQRHPRYADFSIGNIVSDRVDQILDNSRYIEMKSEIESGVKKCAAECSYFELCGGGAPSNKLFEHGTFSSSKTKFCRATKMTVVDAIIAEADRQRASPWRSGRGNVFTVPDIADAATCRRHIEQAEKSIWRPSGISDEREASRDFAAARFDSKSIFSAIRDVLPDRIDGRRLVRIAEERMIYLRYSQAHFFAMHTDSPYEAGDKTSSLFTLMIYLNDDFEGGGTYFPDIDRVVSPKAGAALMFPHSLRHEGQRLLGGTKYALHTFVLYAL